MNEINTKLTTIAENTRSLTGRTDTLSLDEMGSSLNSAASEIDTQAEVINEIITILNDKIAPGSEGTYQEGIEEGRVREREAFWNALLQNGNRASFEMLFQGHTWDFSTFYPTCDLIVRGSASKMFFQWSDSSRIPFYKGSLINRLNECGVVLDTSQATNLTSLFNYTYITEIPTIDFTNAPNSTHCFANGYYYLTKIEKIIVTPETTYTSWFVNALGLAEIRIQGTIGQNGFDIHWSTGLSRESILSIMAALSTNTASLSIKLSLTAVNKAFETSNGAANGTTSPEWQTILTEHSNWTVEYA